MYFSTSRSVEDFADLLLEAFAAVDLTRPVFLAGDFNCRIDQSPAPPRTRALQVLLQDAGLWIVNDPDIKTYESSNGSSTIDLIAVNIAAQHVSCVTRVPNSTMTIIRKHIPMSCPSLKVPSGLLLPCLG
jgi:hypothetical protein